MAKIWRVYEGKEPTIGGPWIKLPLAEAISVFDLKPEDRVSEPRTTPRFGDIERDLTYAGYKVIVVEVERKEGQALSWKPGFYRSRIKPKEAFVRLIRNALVSKLGERNVERLELQPTTDSQGREALRVLVVIAPGADQRLKGGAVLDALVSLQETFRELRDDRIPIVEYATEEELAQDGAAQS